MIFCNAVPISQACFLDKSVIRDSHKAIFKAVKDLTVLGRSLHIAFNFSVLIINNMSLQVVFTNKFKTAVNNYNYESKMRKSDDPCNKFWKTTTEDK